MRDLAETATIVVRRWVPAEDQVERAESDLRLELAELVKAEGVVL